MNNKNDYYTIPDKNLPIFNKTLISAYTTSATNYTYTFDKNMYTDVTASISADTVDVSKDIRIKGVSLTNTLNSIMDRLSILQPDPAKLEKYEALKTAYEHYKTLERLLNE